MALIKFGSVVIDGSGKLGGHVFQNSKGGMQLRTKPIPSGKPSLSQISIRSINKTLQKGWHDLTDAQRKVWNDWAVSHSIMTVRDPRKPISGHDLWMKYNFTNLFNGDPVQHLPYGPDGPLYGPELILNGTFDSAANWIVSVGWGIVGGKAIYADTNNSYLDQNLVLNAGLPVKLEFDISDCPATTYLRFYALPNAYLLAAPYNVPLYLSNGHYVFMTSILNNSTRFRLYGNVVGSYFKVDNISLKQIF